MASPRTTFTTTTLSRALFHQTEPTTGGPQQQQQQTIRCFGTENRNYANTQQQPGTLQNSNNVNNNSSSNASTFSSHVNNHNNNNNGLGCMAQGMITTGTTIINSTVTTPKGSPTEMSPGCGPKPAKLKRRWLEQSYQQENPPSSSYGSDVVSSTNNFPQVCSYYTTTSSCISSSNNRREDVGLGVRQSDDQTARPSVLVMASPSPASSPCPNNNNNNVMSTSSTTPRIPQPERTATFHSGITGSLSKTLYMDEEGRYFHLQPQSHNLHLDGERSSEDNNYSSRLGYTTAPHHHDQYPHYAPRSTLHLTAHM
jgi:hypothetical protein